jgi:hypothetical protein
MVETTDSGARESIRIAEKFIPDDLARQEALAREILAAIHLCEAQLGEEIINRAKEVYQ